MNPIEELKGKTIVVTGAGNGIGYETLTLLKKLGATVVALDIEGTRIQEHEPTIQCDVTNYGNVQNTWERIYREYGKIHGLVNSAGISYSEWIERIGVEEYKRVWEVNVLGTFLNSQEFISSHFEGLVDYGYIVNMGSLGSEQAFRGGAAYVATKGAVKATTRQMGRELRGKFCVTCIQPETLGGPSLISEYIVARLEETRRGQEFCEQHNCSPVDTYRQAEGYFRGTQDEDDWQTCEDIARLTALCLTSWARPLSGSCLECRDGRS